MIYSTRAQSKVKESHIHKVPKSNRFIFHTGEVSELWYKTMANMFSFIVLKSRHVFQIQNLESKGPGKSSRTQFPCFQFGRATVQ